MQTTKLEPLVTIMGGKQTVKRCRHHKDGKQCGRAAATGQDLCRYHLAGSATESAGKTDAVFERQERAKIWLKMVQSVIRNPIRMR